jgi:DNA-binding IclR family transcriptional regulator
MPAAKRTRTKHAEPVRTLSTNANGDRYFSRAVGKALELLDLFQAEEGPLALNQAAKRLQLSKTSTFRLLCTLESTGCLISTDSGRYQLAPGIHSIIPAKAVVRLLRVATPFLQDLTRELGETVSMAALFDNRIEVIAVFESAHLIRMSNVIGHILPPNASSLGKAIAAFLTEARREKLLRSVGVYRFTDRTISDRMELSREFDQVRNQRFAVDREETVTGGMCFGVPIVSKDGTVTAAISSSIPKARVGDAAWEKALVETLTRSAEAIARKL